MPQLSASVSSSLDPFTHQSLLLTTPDQTTCLPPTPHAAAPLAAPTATNRARAARRASAVPSSTAPPSSTDVHGPIL
ncbi:hypothetical protein D9619_011241 [Psilocybe cf. subviscida]|uniref:Uncharacterized protein n=1 Tax=Psilocybe cf. subviscida TaxID=2480587 RepID=A0A8H5F516_9AGAR|nr:hypothetical protein D9619_011241 [Psilocybe cf. subviscida]